MNGLTFSALPRAFACRLSTVLPRVDEPSEDARAGTARHRFFQRVTELVGTVMTTPDSGEEARPLTLEDARELALAEAPEDLRAALEAIAVETLGLENVAAEVALALDLETGTARELGRGIERRYGDLKPTEIAGTVDRLGFVGADGLHVGDYKGRSHARKASQDPQILAGALAASRAYGRTWAELEVVRIVDGEAYPDRAKVDVIDLDSFETRLHELRARIRKDREAFAAGELPEAQVADHCRYCPSLRYCPAQGALVRAMLGGDSDEIQGIVKVGAAYLDELSAARLQPLIGQAEKRLEIVKEALRNFARQTPFPLNDGSGRWYGVPPDAETREIVDHRLVAQVLAELLGLEAAKKGAKVLVSFEGEFGIEAAVREWLTLHPEKAKRGALKAGVEAVEGELTKRGLILRRVGGVVRLHKRKER